ncbi:hypothetical protein SAMN04487949_0628 [Halogranum gelatinilyticum]|uniref:Uncharacterized protein n=1 Tax=Halogranum gelatinilyticum TaxID=660521 RepID=A0A1G9Q0B7_9EURY|nr:hypothetical protein [Halogranum gelatinilyticum]SDM04454.1 hypothetical protein SAMN04487949_0628 [Halogranum gelatinilyticum]
MPSDTETGQGFDRRRLAFGAVFLSLVALWYATHPAQFAAEFSQPVTYVLAALTVVVLVVSAHRRLRETWLFGLSLGLLVAVWGLHNLAGPAMPLLTGYGFVVLGVCGVGYAVYTRIRDRSASEA